MGGRPTETSQKSPAYTDTIHLRNITPTPIKSTFPPVTKIFTTDAVAMYQDIDTDKVMLIMERFFKGKKVLTGQLTHQHHS